MTDKTQRKDDSRALIKEALESIGWSESQLSRAAGVSQPNLNQFLAGKRGISEEGRSRVMAALETQLSIDVAAKEAELAALQNTSSKVRLTPEAAARIRQRANEILVAEDAHAAAKLATHVLFATARYISKHEQGLPDGVADIAAERIYQQYEGMFELMRKGPSPEEVCGALGIYIARLELTLAQAERRITDMEARQK